MSSTQYSTESTPPSPTLPPVANPNQFDATFDWIEERVMAIIPNLTYNLMCLRHFFKLAAAVSVACFIASVVFQFKFKHNRPSFIISFTIAESITVLAVLLLLNYPWIENRISFRKPCQLYLAIENRFWIRLPKISGVYLGYLLVGGYAPVICSGCPAAFVIFYICMVKLYGGQVNQCKIIEDFSIAFIIPIVDQFRKQLLHEPPIEVNKIEEEVQPYIFGIVFLIPILFGIVARMCPQLPCTTIEEESTTHEEETTTTSAAIEDETHIDMESATISAPVGQTISSNPVVVETELVEDGEVHLEQDKITLLFPVDTPPISVISTAKISGIPFIADSSRPIGSTPFFQFTSALELHGTNVLLRYLGRVATLINLSGQNALESAQIDEWLDYSTKFSLGSGFEEACSYVDTYLSGRTFLVGNSFSLADITIWSALAGSGQRWESSRKSKKYPIAMRWFDLIAEEYKMPLTEVTSTYIGERGVGKAVVIPTATPTTTPTASTPTASEKTSLSFGSSTPQRDGAASVDDLVVAVEDVCCCCGTCSGSEHTVPLEGKVGGRPTFEADLPDAKVGEVCLCFSPEPIGYLHIEHSKAALLNQYFAQRYQGRLIIRFGDTNPAKESTEFVEHLLKDIKTLGIKYDAVTYTSDYFPQLLKMAEGLLLKGKAYIDDTPRERLQKERMDGIESECRKNSPEKNLELWKEMIAGSERGLQCCLRGKLDMQDPNISLRDPVYYRCNPMPHHRVGFKYKMYPTYEFACPFVDSTEGITHALRSSEYHDHNAQYYRILEDMGLPNVQIYEFSRLNMVYTLLSNNNLLWFVQKGKVEGWDDPRLPTVQGIVRRGLKIESLIQFILEQEVSKNLNLVEWEKLWMINKKIIDPLCPRHTAVLEERRVVLKLIDGPEKPFVRIIPRHKKFEGAGKKATTYTKRIWLDYADASSVSVGEEITLMDWGNAIIKEIGKDQDGFVTQITGVLNLEGSVKTTKLKLTWLPETDELVNLSLVELDYLITKKKLEEGEDFKDVLNPNTKKETLALGDSNMRNLKRGEILQLERKGYFRCDVPFFRPSKPVVLIAIPDGRQQASPK